MTANPTPRQAAGLALLVALALWPRLVAAWDFPFFDGEASLQVTETFSYTYYFNNDPKEYDLSVPLQQSERLEKLHDDTFHQIFNKLDVSLTVGEVRVGARLDLHVFANSPIKQHCGGDAPPSWCSRADNRYNDTFAAEQLYILLTRPAFDLTLGDFSASFGRGIALHLVQLDEVGQDTTIRGGKLDIHHGDLGFTFLAGLTNALELDKTTGYDAPWDDEPILGARLEYRLLDLVIVGAHTVWVLREDHTGVMDNGHDAIWGVGFEVPSLHDGMFSLVGEVNFRQTVASGELVRGPGRDGAGLDGVAAYARASFNIWDLTAFAEFKYYNEFELIGFGEHPYRHMYHLPPTLDRKKAEIKEGNSDVSGVRLNLEYVLGELGPVELMVFANYGYFESWEREQGVGTTGLVEDVDLSIHSAYGGLELSWAEGTGQVNANAGARRLHDNITDELFHDVVHFEVSVDQALGRHGISARFLLLDKATRKIGLDEWREMEVVLSYGWSPYFTVSLTYERQEDPTVVPWVPVDASDPTSTLAPRPLNLFGAQIRGYITGSTYVNLRIGENRAGIKCLNGICRQVPAFSGVEGTLVVRY